MSRPTQDTTRYIKFTCTGLVTLYGSTFQTIPLRFYIHIVLQPPIAETIGLGYSISLATTWGITIVFSSSGYLDVSVLRVCSLR